MTRFAGINNSMAITIFSGVIEFRFLIGMQRHLYNVQTTRGLLPLSTAFFKTQVLTQHIEAFVGLTLEAGAFHAFAWVSSLLECAKLQKRK